MRLSSLLGEACNPDPEIAGLTADSRAVRPGFLFAALPGEKVDGAAFIADAERAGAAAILARPGARSRVVLVADANPRRRLAAIAARFYERQPRIVVGVTGTNGKTSTTRFAAALWRSLGRGAGSLGTLGAEGPSYARPLQHTTPEPIVLHETLAELAGAGADSVAMEVSSHALAQHRADGVCFAGAAFTNITQDHLDFHGSFEAYFAAKLRLFTELVPPEGFAAINADGAGSRQIAEAAGARGLRLVTTGAAGRTLRLTRCEPEPSGLRIAVSAEGAARAPIEINLGLIGRFQAENALLAAGAVIGAGEAIEPTLDALRALEGPPGRMQFAATAAGGAVYIDYAHTPDAVATALAAIRPHATGRLIAIIGAGGDRDRTKRPLMGRAAAAAADIVIVADDNPRSEDPAEIRRAILAGAPGALEIGDRGEAIRRGVSMLEPGDVLLIAGKGHETGQEIGGRVLPFSDLVAARQAAAEREPGR
jgi:UDP-N-acetylmuramoyl-L-alanyl-D-glutamate--2,6-diaminopimelate ligase